MWQAENKVVLKEGKTNILSRKHLWMFSGALHQWAHPPQEGELTEIIQKNGEVLAYGMAGTGSIALRILGFGPPPISGFFAADALKNAVTYRQKLGYFDQPETNAFRLVHGEGDGLPGLVIDWYAGHVVIQTHHAGWHRWLAPICESLLALLPQTPETVVAKNATRGEKETVHFLKGDAPSTWIKEHGFRFLADWTEGQKTGMFIDQRVSRQLVKEWSAGKNVLNTFCYTGGFSIMALAGGASKVTSVDVSAKAMAATEVHLQENFPGAPHQSITADVLPWLAQHNETYDLMIVDPPAFAKSVHHRHAAIKAYIRLNAAALKNMAPGGLLFTFSCSQVVDNQQFRQSLVSAAMEANRSLRLVQPLTQPSDHPVNPFHPETEYLKGLLLYVE